MNYTSETSSGLCWGAPNRGQSSESEEYAGIIELIMWLGGVQIIWVPGIWWCRLGRRV